MFDRLICCLLPEVDSMGFSVSIEIGHNYFLTNVETVNFETVNKEL